MLTEYGKAVRKLRIDLAMTLRNMAAELGLTPAYLSGVETGRKPVGDRLVQSVVELFRRKGVDADHLVDAAALSREEVRLRLQQAREDQQHLAVALARRFSELSPKQVEEIVNVLKEEADR